MNHLVSDLDIEDITYIKAVVPSDVYVDEETFSEAVEILDFFVEHEESGLRHVCAVHLDDLKNLLEKESDGAVKITILKDSIFEGAFPKTPTL